MMTTTGQNLLYSSHEYGLHQCMHIYTSLGIDQLNLFDQHDGDAF